jgi:hypothetical protein
MSLLKFPTFKSLMEDCPACGERCNGIPVKWENGNKGVWCYKADAAHIPEGWSYKESENGCSTLIAKTLEAQALWDSTVEDAEGKAASGATRRQGFGKKTKAVQAVYYLPQEHKNAFIAAMQEHNYYASGNREAQEDLHKRGLFNEQICKHNIFDLNQKGYAASPIPSNLWEVAREWLGTKVFRGLKDGSTWKSDSNAGGYLVPIFNYNTEIVGFQIRTYPSVIRGQEAQQREMKQFIKHGNHYLEEEKAARYKKKGVYVAPKYLWAKGVTRANKEVSSHLSIGRELPLQTLKAEKPCKTLLLVEGTLKPIVVYERLQGKFHVLGAAGGSFTSSSEILKMTLQAFIAEHNIQQVVWLADAGSYSRRVDTTRISETQKEWRVRRENELHIHDYTEDVYGRTYTLRDAARKLAFTTIRDEAKELSGRWADSGMPTQAPFKRQNIVGNIGRAKAFVTKMGLDFHVADWGQLEVEGGKDQLDPDTVAPETILAAIPKEPAAVEQPNMLDIFKPLRMNSFQTNHHKRVSFKFPEASYEKKSVATKEEIPTLIAATDKKYVVVNTPTGMGKSSIIHTIPFQEMGFAKHVYVSLTPRNPTTSEIESEFYSLEGRHGGLVIELGKKTPNGLNVLRRPKGAEEPQTPANCAFNEDHKEARENSLDGMGICKACPFYKQCISGDHEHYNYLYQHITAKKMPQVRASILALNPADIDETVLITIDEPAQAAPSFEEVRYSLGEVTEWTARINQKAGLEQGGFIVDFACNLVAGKLDAEEIVRLAALVDEDLKERKKQLSRMKSKQRSLRPEALRFAKLVLQGTSWKERGGYFSAIVKHEHNLGIIGNAGKVVFLDATVTPEKFSVEYGISLEECLFITCEDKATKSVTIVPLLTPHWNGRGQQDNPDKLTILEHTRNTLALRHSAGKLGVITFSPFAKEGDMQWFSESRGSNRFKEMEAILLTGLPFINIAVCQDHYALHKAEFEAALISFEDYQNICLHEEIKQAIGRIRGFHRTEPLVVYVMCNASFPQLEKEGYTVTPMPLVDFGIAEATTPQLESLDNLLPAVTKMVQEGLKMTLQTVGDNIGKCKQAVSKGLKKLGISLAELIQMVRTFVQTEINQGAKTFNLSDACVEDLLTRKTLVEENRLEDIKPEKFSYDESVLAIKKINEGWFPRGVRQNELFYLRTSLLSRLSQEYQDFSCQNGTVWDRLVHEWEINEILENEYATNR